MEENILKHNFNINKINRIARKGHRPLLLWFTGLSGSGKSTISNLVEKQLHQQNIHTYALDGDNLRTGLNKDLTFSPADRKENIRRVAETANLMVDAGLVVVASFISPYKADRDQIKIILGDANVVEIFINTSVEECEKRDVKGLYKKARNGEIKNFTGISAPYEIPDSPDVEICTEKETIEESVTRILEFVTPKLKVENE